MFYEFPDKLKLHEGGDLMNLLGEFWLLKEFWHRAETGEIGLPAESGGGSIGHEFLFH